MKATILAACAIVALFLVDCCGGKTERIAAVVEGRVYHPAYTTTSCHGKPVVCETTRHPADYDLVVHAEDGYHTIDTNAAGYATCQNGDTITYKQRRGCMSHVAWLASYYR